MFRPTDPASKEKGTIRDRTTDNVKEDLEKAAQLDVCGPKDSNEENPVVGCGNGGDKIKWHQGPGHKHEAVLFHNNKDDISVRNNLKNMEDAPKEV